MFQHAPHAVQIERSGSPMPRRWRPLWKSKVIAAFGASSLFGVILGFSNLQRRRKSVCRTGVNSPQRQIHRRGNLL